VLDTDEIFFLPSMIFVLCASTHLNGSTNFKIHEIRRLNEALSRNYCCFIWLVLFPWHCTWECWKCKYGHRRTNLQWWTLRDWTTKDVVSRYQLCKVVP